MVLWVLSGSAVWATDAGKPREKQILEDLVVTVTRSEEKIIKVPAKIEVINREEIELTVGDTITEQLKKNTSIGVIEYPGALAGIGIRGFRPEFSGITKRSLTLKNGRPAGATNLATVLVDNIERIEVIKGPASALYGGEAMGGVVNIITKKNTGELTGKAEAGLGSFATHFQKVSLGGGLGSRFDFDIYGRRYDQQDDITVGSGQKRANTSYNTRNGGLRIGADLGDTWRIDVSGDIYQGRDIETPGDIAYGNTHSGNKDIDNFGLDFTIGGDVGMNNRLSFTGYHTGEKAENYYRYSGSTIVPPYRSYDSETSWLGFQLKDDITWSAHRFLLGVDYQKIDKESRKYNTDGSREAPSSPDESRENWAGYLETILKFMDERLTATVGGRYDTFHVKTVETPYKSGFTPNTENFSTFSPRAGLNYLFDPGVRLHTTVGKGFVPPSAFELAGYSEAVVNGATMITEGNANLDPETSITYDVGVGFGRPAWGLSLDATYFHTDVDDKIVSVQTGNYKTYENGLGAEIEGLETMISFDIGAPLGWDRSLELFANATHIFKAEEEQSDRTLKDIHNVAEYTLNYGIQYSDGLFDGKVHVRNQGKMKDTDWVTEGYPEIEYPSFTVVDLAFGVTLFSHHRLLIKVDNLLDKNYYEKKGYPKPGCAFYGSYRFEF
ncbi:MAG: TonB-dependent receptor [Desulfatitalea sp.]|nr:TonB-dependent receptor [Desulfatitalea sp.]NNK01410.1 TonB-dependent receptor [Desulfatitalea sp.]